VFRLKVPDGIHLRLLKEMDNVIVRMLLIMYVKLW